MSTQRLSRFELTAAYVLGVALPVLEICRRRTDFSDVPAYLDDLIVGAFLWWAARSVDKGRAYGAPLLVAAWGVLCGGLWASVFGQLQKAGHADVSGLPNIAVIIIKLLIYLVALVSLRLSIIRTTRGNHK